MRTLAALARCVRLAGARRGAYTLAGARPGAYRSRRSLGANCLLALTVVLAGPAFASAQSSIAVRGYGSFGTNRLAATETYDAVADTTGAVIFGGGAQVTGLWRGLFADVAVSQLSVDGERVFIDDAGTVFELGVPLEVTQRPIDVAAGWRFTFGRVSPYAGAGITYLSYEETSEFSDAGEDVSESGAGALVLGGVDVLVWRWIHAGGEVRYRRVTGILGESGVSSHFGEDDAGGISAAVRISIGR